jgi:hypothetical protein
VPLCAEQCARTARVVASRDAHVEDLFVCIASGFTRFLLHQIQASIAVLKQQIMKFQDYLCAIRQRQRGPLPLRNSGSSKSGINICLRTHRE